MLLATLDIDSGLITLDPAFGSTLLRMRVERVAVLLYDAGAKKRLGATGELLVVIKPRDQRDDALLASDGSVNGVLIDEDDYTAQDERYVKLFSLVTVPVDALLKVNGDPDDDVKSAPCDLWIGYRAISSDDWRMSQKVEVTLEHGGLDEDDDPPDSVGSPDDEWVAHNHAQTLTSDQQTQARTNIGAASASSVAAKANTASPTFTGTPAAPTATFGTNTTQLATTQFVQAAMNARLRFMGQLDASTEPDYPLASVGHIYHIVNDGKVGGASGRDVVNGDMLVCWYGAVAGDEVSVGSAWSVYFGPNRFASQAEAEAGTNTTKIMTPERVAQAIAALA